MRRQQLPRPLKDTPHIRLSSKFAASDSIRPETLQKLVPIRPKDPPKTEALLAEQTISNKEQRKADWAILKEMARYLWPKVSQVQVSIPEMSC